MQGRRIGPRPSFHIFRSGSKLWSSCSQQQVRRTKAVVGQKEVYEEEYE